mmetsp:Transcript_8153/g.19698  ORF Transcript_8153/g.19698 Transcript_8153/m.19698 type:complete len:1153 (+) Transcript_8153:536-3994(+)
MSGFADVLERDDQAREQMMGEFNPGKYRGLIRHIGLIKENIAIDKAKYEENESQLKKQIEKQDVVAKVVQKQLSTQIEITNRGYASLLQQMQGKTEECKNLEEKVRLLSSEIDLKQREAAVDLKKHMVDSKQKFTEKEVEVRNLKRSIEDLKRAGEITERELEKRIRDVEYIVEKKEEGLQKLIDDNTKLERLVASERGRIAGIQSEANRRVTEFEEKTKVVQFSYGEKCEEVKKLEQIIRDRDEEIRGIINRDADFDPEKDKNEALAKQKIEFDQQLAKKEVGYKQLIADFSNMEKKKAEELEMLKETSTKVRQQLEEEMKLTRLELITKQTLLEEKIKEGAEEREFWLEKYEKLEKMEQESRDGFKKKIKGLEEERDIAVEAMSKLKEYTDNVAQREASRKDEKSGEVAALMHKLRRLETLLKDTNTQCEEALLKKDLEMQKYMEQLAKLQEQITAAKKRERDVDFLWEERMREKEVGQEHVLRELEELKEEFVFAEQKVEEARLKQDAAQKKVRLIEAQLAEQLRLKQVEIDRLNVVIVGLEKDVEREIKRQKEIEELWIKKVAEVEERERQALEVKDEQIMELKALQKKLEKTIQNRIAEINELREELDDLGREMEEEIQTRDRIIEGLRAEITSLKEMYEEMIGELRAQYDKLKKTYDLEVGEGGVQEQKQKAERLEKDMAALREVVDQLKQKIVELKAIIREKDLEQEELQKETMDLLFIKETAYKKLAGECAELKEELEKWEYKQQEIEAKAQKDAFKMKKFFDRQLAAKDVTIQDKEDIIEKNKEWLVEIEHWKKENEKRMDEHAALNRLMEQRISEKEKGMQYLVDEVGDLKQKLADQEQMYEDKIFAREKAAQHDNFLKDEEYKKLEREGIEVQKERNQLKLELSAAIADGQKIDPEKVALAKLAEQNTVTIEEGKRAIEVMVTENEEQRKRARDTEEQCAIDLKRAKKSEETEIKRREHAERELKLVKEMCEEQMVRAEQICKGIEDRYRALPNPFQDEVVEVRERVEQQKAGIENLRLENDVLVREMQQNRKAWQDERMELEKKLVYATTVLNEVSSLGEIRGLAQREGIDIDADPDEERRKKKSPRSPKGKLMLKESGSGVDNGKKKKKEGGKKVVGILPTVEEETKSEAASSKKPKSP